jgi:hypothetical protein
MKTIFNRLLRMAGDTMDYSAIMLPPAKGFDASRQVMTPANYFSRTMERKDAPPELTAAEIKSWEDLKTVFLGTHKSLKTFIEKANGEIATTGKVATETTNAMKTLSESLNGLGTRLDKIEAKANRFGAEADVRKSTGEQFTALDDFKNIVSGTISKLRMDIKGLDIKAITNATGQNQPLVPDMRLPGVQILPNRILTIRDLLPVGRTSSNLVQYAKENVFTNNAGPQAGNSPTAAGENLVKNESDITFTLANAPVVTLAHFILVSRQVLDDAPMLESYINGRLHVWPEARGRGRDPERRRPSRHARRPDAPGDGFNRSAAGTKIDILRRAMTQLHAVGVPGRGLRAQPATGKTSSSRRTRRAATSSRTRSPCLARRSGAAR